MFRKLSLLVLVMAFGLTFSIGCEEGSAPPTTEEVQDAANEAADDTKDAAEEAGDAAKEAAEEGAEKAEDAADAVGDAMN